MKKIVVPVLLFGLMAGAYAFRKRSEEVPASKTARAATGPSAPVAPGRDSFEIIEGGAVDAVRCEAIDRLGERWKTQPPAAGEVDRLRRRLESERSPGVRDAIVTAFASLPRDQAAPLLRAALEAEPDEDVRLSIEAMLRGL